MNIQFKILFFLIINVIFFCLLTELELLPRDNQQQRHGEYLGKKSWVNESFLERHHKESDFKTSDYSFMKAMKPLTDEIDGNFSFMDIINSFSNGDDKVEDDEDEYDDEDEDEDNDIRNEKDKNSNQYENIEKVNNDKLDSFSLHKTPYNDNITIYYTDFETELLLNSGFFDISSRVIVYYDTIRELYSNMNIFRKLKAYKEVTIEYFNAAPKEYMNYFYPNTALINENAYCDIVDIFNLYNPDNLFHNQNFFTDYHPDGLIRNYVINKIGTNTMPMVHKDLKREIFFDRLYPFNITISIFFTKRVAFHYYHEIGKDFLCNSQMYNHIPGHGIMTRKDLVVGAINDYAKKYENKTHCFNRNMFFPYAYRLNVLQECKAFFHEISTKEYKLKKVDFPYQFLLKAGFGAHRGSGVWLFDQEKEGKIRKIYKNGSKCGENHTSTVMQKYVTNPLLLEGHKFDFRIYMLIASTDPLIAYYHDGFLKVSLHIYDPKSKQKRVHLCNTHLSQDIFKKAAKSKEFMGMNETELRDYQLWTLTELKDHLLEIGKISDPNWLDNHLRRSFQQTMVHLIRASEKSFFKQSNVFEIFGIDFVLDESLHVWFIECNASPQFVPTGEVKNRLLTRLLQELFEIQFAYLRSRMKRVNTFMLHFYRNTNNQKAINWELWSQRFSEINKNKLEPEFQISSNNTFRKIIDRSLIQSSQQLEHQSHQDHDIYMGLLDHDCIDDN